MDLVGRITDETLKVGDIISQWARFSSRETLGSGTDYMELQRHIIIEVFDNGVKTSILFRRDSDGSPGRQDFISFMTLMAGYWRKEWK